MTILDVVRGAATVTGLAVPDQLYGLTDRWALEMQSTIRRSARRIRDEYDWQAITLTTTLNGTGSAADFALPSDYLRMPKKAELFSTANPNWPLERVLTANEWLDLTTRNMPSPYGQWSLYGNRIRIRPTLANGHNVPFVYLTKNIAQSAAGAAKDVFNADDDSFVLSEDLLELAIIWDWKKSHGQAYDAEYQDYDDALITAMDNDKGSKPVVGGTTEHFADVRTAFPWNVGEAP